MFELDGLVGLIVFGVWLYCVYDVITSDEHLVRHLPKMVWIFLVIILFDVGAILWLIAGRPQSRNYRPGMTDYRNQRRPMGAEDRPGFAGAPGSHADDVDPSHLSDIVREREEQARLKVWEAQLKRREEELKRREQGGTGEAQA